MEKNKDPLHGVTLAMILEFLVEHCGWKEMGKAVDIRCFNNDPSIKSSLHFCSERRGPVRKLKIYMSRNLKN